MYGDIEEFGSKYFELFSVAGGVYAAVEKKNAGTGSNSGIIDLGGLTVIFDTFLNLEAAADLKRAAEILTGRKPALVINSHYHMDHVSGNQVFESSARIICSKKARNLMEKNDELIALFRDEGYEKLRELEATLEKTVEPHESLELMNEIQYRRNILNPSLRSCLPDVTFEGSMTLHGKTRELELLSFDIAHTRGDAVGILREEGIVFMGDILFCDIQPWMGSGDPVGLMEALDRIQALGFKHFIPGHGRLGAVEDIEHEKRYVEEMMELIEKKGVEARNEDLTEIFSNWDSLTFEWNKRFLMSHQGR